MNIFSFSRESNLLMHYGIFVTICHATAILFMSLTYPSSLGAIHFHRFFPMLEHSMVSFIAILIGVVGIEYIKKKET